MVKNRRPYRRSRVLVAVDPTHAYAKPANLDDDILRFGATLVGMTPETLALPQGIASAAERLLDRLSSDVLIVKPRQFSAATAAACVR